MTSPALQSVESLDAIARAIAEHSRADEFPKYADDPSIYRGAVEGAIANLCKARGVRQRLMVYKIQVIAWNTAERAGTLADVKAVLTIANDEIDAIRENNAAADKRIPIAKTEPVRFGGEQTMPRDNIAPRPPKPTLVPEAPKPALTGGLFGTKPAEPGEREWWVTPQGTIYSGPKGKAQERVDDHGPYPSQEDAEGVSDAIHEGLKPQTPAIPSAPEAPAADADKATVEPATIDKIECLNDWAVEDDKRKAFWAAVRGINGASAQKNVRDWALGLLGAADEFHIAMRANEALNVLREKNAKPEPEPEQTIDAQTGEITPAPKPAAMTVYQPSSPALLPEQAHWMTMREQAAILIKSGFLPQSIRTPEQAIALMMMGEALNVKPIIALQSINVIQGKPTVSPQLMLALIRKSGQLQDLTVTDDGSTCKVVMTRKGETPHTETFSMTDAGAMGLAGKDNWKKQPAVMRKWRAISAACRVVFPDIILGFYTPEEINPDVVVDDAA